MKDGMIEVVLFCEYVIPDNHRSAFLAWVNAMAEHWGNIEILENTEQPGVFVEFQSVNTAEEAVEREKERREGRSWREMEQWIKGGREGLRIWTFRPVVING